MADEPKTTQRRIDPTIGDTRTLIALGLINQDAQPPTPSATAVGVPALGTGRANSR